MAVNKFNGNAPAVAQVATVTPGGTIEADDRFIMTMTAEDGTTQVLSVAAGGTSVGVTCDAIVAAWNAATGSLFTAITATLVGTTPTGTAVTLTADTAGVPFYIAVSTTEAGGGAADDQTFGQAATTANSGPNDIKTAANWSESYVPTAGGGHAADTVVIPASCGSSILYGLDLSAEVLTGDIEIEQGYAGQIASQTAPLKLQCEGTLTWRAGARQFIYLDGNASGAVRILHATAAPSTGLYAANLTGVDVVSVYVNPGSDRASVGLGAGAGETFETDALTIQSGQVTLGSLAVKQDGATAIPLIMAGGTVLAKCALGAVVKTGGDLTIEGSGAVAAVRGTGSGRVQYNTSGTLTLWNGSDEAGITFANNPGCTVTTAYKRSTGSALLDPNRRVTWTNPPELPYTRINDPNLDLGSHVKLTVAAAT